MCMGVGWPTGKGQPTNDCILKEKCLLLQKPVTTNCPSSGGEVSRVPSPFHAGILTGLILYKPCTGNHRGSELMCASATSCLEDSSPENSSLAPGYYISPPLPPRCSRGLAFITLHCGDQFGSWDMREKLHLWDRYHFVFEIWVKSLGELLSLTQDVAIWYRGWFFSLHTDFSMLICMCFIRLIISLLTYNLQIAAEVLESSLLKVKD